MLVFTLLFVSLLTRGTSTTLTNRCPQPTDLDPVPQFFMYGHPDDCQQFFLCSFGYPYLMKCPAGTSFSEVYHVCVHRYSPEDTCAQQNAVRECSKGARIIANPGLCHRYFNCSSIGPVVESLGPYQDECPYPQLFDITTSMCKPYFEVACSGRVEVKDKCGYVKAYQCVDPVHCDTCIDVNPSCINLTDGDHPNPYKLWTTYFIRCTDERVEPLFCPRILNMMGVFSPVKNQCVSLYEVPKAENIFGRLPQCVANAVGTFAIPGDSRVYYNCPGPIVYYCPNGTAFDSIRKICV